MSQPKEQFSIETKPKDVLVNDFRVKDDLLVYVKDVLYDTREKSSSINFVKELIDIK